MNATATQQLRERLRLTGMSNYRIALTAGVGDAVVRRFMAGHSVSTQSFDRLAAAFEFTLQPVSASKHAATSSELPQGGL